MSTENIQYKIVLSIFVIIFSTKYTKADVLIGFNGGVSIIPKFQLNTFNPKNNLISQDSAKNKNFIKSFGIDLTFNLNNFNFSEKLDFVISTYHFSKINPKYQINKNEYNMSISNRFVSTGLSYNFYQKNNMKYFIEGGFAAGKVNMSGSYRKISDSKDIIINVRERYISPYAALAGSYKMNNSFTVGFKGLFNILPKQIIQKDNNETITSNINGLQHINIILFFKYKIF